MHTVNSLDFSMTTICEEEPPQFGHNHTIYMNSSGPVGASYSNGHIHNVPIEPYIDKIIKSELVIGIINRKISILKSRDSNYNDDDDDFDKDGFIELITKLIINFKHPIYLPTIDEAVSESIKEKLKVLIDNPI